jgi:aminoglycoside phosphotransferase (APT) family kinase protein
MRSNTSAIDVSNTVAAQLGGAAHIIRHGMNLVVNCGDVIIRVGPPPTGDQLEPTAAAIRLSQLGVPVARPLRAPELIDGWWVTIWEQVDPTGEDTNAVSVGQQIRHLHSLPAHSFDSKAPLSWCGQSPWLQIDERLDRLAAHISGQWHDALSGAWAELHDWQHVARSAPQCIVHGDVHPGNFATRGAAGDPATTAVLLDWDLLSIGPQAWDHAPLMTWTSRWGGRPGLYEEFAEGYGVSLVDDPLAERLARLRLLAATVGTALRALEQPALMPNIANRMRYWLGDPDAPAWSAV